MDFISVFVGFMLSTILTIIILIIFMNREDTPESKNSAEILYICDRKAEYCCHGAEECDRPYCKYTTDIDHAANFKKIEQEYLAYVEEDR
jgi:hypothetical protein